MACVSRHGLTITNIGKKRRQETPEPVTHQFDPPSGSLDGEWLPRVTRFAPSPTGLLHLGHAYAALSAFTQGEWFLPWIEDIDTSRCRESFVTAIVADMTWLGMGRTGSTPVKRTWRITSQP